MSIRVKISDKIMSNKGLQSFLAAKDIVITETDEKGVFVVDGPDWLPKGNKVYEMFISLNGGYPNHVNFW